MDIYQEIVNDIEENRTENNKAIIKKYYQIFQSKIAEKDILPFLFIMIQMIENLLKHIQNLKNENDSLKNEIQYLKNEADSLKNEIDSLKPPKNFIPDIFEAAKKGHKESVEFLIEKNGVYIESEDKFKHTPLYYALQYNHKPIYEYILNKLQMKIPDNFVPSVYKAALDGNLACLTILNLYCNFHLYLTDENGKLPLYYACKSGNIDTIKYCDEYKPIKLKGKLPDKFEPNPFKASKEGDISSLEYLIETAGFDIREKDEQSGFDILQITCIERQSKIVNYCVEQLKLPELPEKFESNIDKASSSRNLESVEYLFKYVNLSEEQKRSALYNSCNSNYLPIFQFLIKNGMNLDTKFSEPFSTPLHVLCGIQKMNIPFIDFIIKSAKDKAKIVEAKNIQRLTPLHIASLSGNLYTVIYLIENAEANKEAANSASSELSPINAKLPVNKLSSFGSGKEEGGGGTPI